MINVYKTFLLSCGAYLIDLNKNKKYRLIEIELYTDNDPDSHYNKRKLAKELFVKPFYWYIYSIFKTKCVNITIGNDNKPASMYLRLIEDEEGNTYKIGEIFKVLNLSKEFNAKSIKETGFILKLNKKLANFKKAVRVGVKDKRKWRLIYLKN